MSDDKTPHRRYPLTARDHAGVIDADRIAEALTLIDNDVEVVLRRATYEALGRVVLGLAADIASGREDVVPTAAAVKEHVAEALADLVGSTPGALDTLAGLAEALGNDPNFATTITGLIAAKADKEATATALNAKADKATTDAAIATKADKTWADSEFKDRYTKSASDKRFVPWYNTDPDGKRVDLNVLNFFDHQWNGDARHIIYYAGRMRVRDGNGLDRIALEDNGNVWGGVWEGGHLHNHIESRGVAYREEAKTWAYASFVQDMRLTGGGDIAYRGGLVGSNGGEVMTGLSWSVMSSRGVDTIRTRYLQKLVTGNWYTIGTW